MKSISKLGWSQCDSNKNILAIMDYFVYHLERWRVTGIVSATMAQEKDDYLGKGFPITVKKDFPSQLMHFRFFSHAAGIHN